MTAHRYWKILIYAANGADGDVLITECELRSAIGGADLTSASLAATNASGSAGYYSAAEGPSKAFNNSTADWWQPRIGDGAGGSVELIWDFGSGNSQDIGEIGLTAHPSYLDRTPAAFKVYGSDDGASWVQTWGAVSTGPWATAARTFTPPAAPIKTLTLSPDAHFANTVLILSGEDFVDYSAANRGLVATVGAAHIASGTGGFRPSSYSLDGTGDYLILPDSDDWNFGNGQFTVEGRIKLTAGIASSRGFTLFAQWSAVAPQGTTCSWALYFDGGNLRFRFYDTAGTMRDVFLASAADGSQWHHFAADRDAGGTLRIYQDGGVATSLLRSETFNNGPRPLRIGSVENFPALDTPGYMEELRITKGVARYAGASFTPSSIFTSGASSVGRRRMSLM